MSYGLECEHSFALLEDKYCVGYLRFAFQAPHISVSGCFVRHSSAELSYSVPHLVIWKAWTRAFLAIRLHELSGQLPGVFVAVGLFDFSQAVK